MKYTILYSCCSHVGRCRKINQDNIICNGKYLDGGLKPVSLQGKVDSESQSLFGVFDGMGGEECGEVAALIAARCAAEASIEDNPVEGLIELCKKTNEKICEYIKNNDIHSMGTTAAFLAFSKTGITLCNIGDSKIYQFADGQLEQISIDHTISVATRGKPPLSQNLGIPSSEMIIEPYVAKGKYNNGDVYLICSDGLTDMVSPTDIANILKRTDFEESASELLKIALSNGGKDNITIILCRVLKKRWNILDRIVRYIYRNQE